MRPKSQRQGPEEAVTQGGRGREVQVITNIRERTKAQQVDRK